MMHARYALSSSAAAALCTLVGLASSGCRGIDADVTYPSDLPSLDNQLQSPEGDNDPSITLGAFKFAPNVCQGIDAHAQTAALTPEDLVRFLDKQGVKVQPVQARPDLFWFDIPNGQENNGKLRLRLAVLSSPALAAKDLHDALLDHGPSWWGVRRSNLALLMPKAGLSEALAFAIKYKLPCWGIFTYAGRDDAYVVPGPYSEP